MAPSDNTTRAFLRRLTHDILQRSPSRREVRAYLDAPVEQVVPHLQRTREAMTVWLEEELYYFLLLDNFRPRTDTIERLPDLLRRDKVSVKRAMLEIMLSTGFSLRNPGNDTFVTVVMEQCLGLEVQARKVKPILEAGKKIYDGRRAKFFDRYGRSQADVVKIVVAQRDFSRHLLDRHHRRLFDEPLPEDKAADVARLHEDELAFWPILAEWFASEEYRDQLATKKPRNDRQFVRSLYNDLLGRQPDYEELRNMRNALQSMADSTPLRAVMAKVILDSGRAEIPDPGDQREFVRDCFLQYLGRQPSQTELASYTATLREPGSTPEHVVRALVASVEYQYY